MVAGPLAPPATSAHPEGHALVDPLQRADPPRALAIPRWIILLTAVLGQVVLTRAMLVSTQIGTVQALVLLGLVIYCSAKRDAVLGVCVLAYLPAAEIVWRQTASQVPYLTAPYLTIAMAVLLTLTTFNRLTKPGRLAALYVMLLLPSTIATISATGAGSRELIAFALAGPIAAATLIVLFSQVTIEFRLYRRLLWVLLVSGIGPLVAAGSAIDSYVAANGGLVFEDESNFITSGGFGPVQVSSVMGLSVLIAVLAFLAERELATRILATAIGLTAAVLSFLTFSRGGMTATALALAALALSYARNPRARMRILAVVLVVFAVGLLVLVPRLNSFTEGAFEERFSDTSSGRTELAANDIEVLKENLAFGVGPGMTKYSRVPWEICQLRSDKCSKEGSSHTEFTRMLSEHGLVGLVAIGVMLNLMYLAVKRAGPSRPITITFLVWAVAQMFYANFRVVGIAFAFGFAFLRIVDRPAPDPDDEAAEVPALAS